ncbi:MAG: NAD-dependent dehydratase, partial [Bacteroidetes bacterium]|nr:NAD-dependent dehydratase [Bacteroidota bacterium]
MTNVLIIGASGSLAHAVIAALKKLPETRLTLFVRRKSRLHGHDADGTTVIEGD